MDLSNIPDVLLKIVETKKIEVSELYRTVGLENMKALADSADTSRSVSFNDALAGDGLSVIAEVKKGSPSAGIIDPVFDYMNIARAYEAGGAAAISVLTDINYFYGSLDYLKEIKAGINIPILRKDFIIDPIQIYEAKAAGADAFLLIAAILSLEDIARFYALGKSLGMGVLTEVHDKEELDKILRTDCDIIGVNNRNLRDFSVDLTLTEKLMKFIPKDKIIVGESGIKTPEDAQYLSRVGSDAVLCGETLVRRGVEKCGDEISAFRAV